MLKLRFIKILIIPLLSMVLHSCSLFFPTYPIEIMNFTPNLGSYSLNPSKDRYSAGEEVLLEVSGVGSAEFCGWFEQELTAIDEHTAKIIVDNLNIFFISFSDKEIDYYEDVKSISNDARSLKTGQLYSTGLIEPSTDEFVQVPVAPEPELINSRSIISSRALLAYNDFPRPLSQGQQGSCTAWAVGFAAKSYFERKKLGWNLGYQDCSRMYSHNFEHIFSPAFIYNQINNGVDEGSAIISALELLETKGICTWAQMPYNENDYTQPSPTALAQAESYKIDNFYRINQTYGSFSISEIQNMKNYLDIGIPIIISVTTDTNLLYPKTKNAIGEYVWNKKDIESGAHAMCIIGYDNSWGFKTMNSWSPYWGDNGFIWIDIAFFQNTAGTAAYVIEDY